MMTGLLAPGTRYASVGLACALINNALMIGLDTAGIGYSLIVVISALVMIPLGYVLQLRFTFLVEAGWLPFCRYAGVMLMNMPLSWLLLFVIHAKGGMPMLFAAPAITVILFVWNYLGSRWAILQRSARR